MTDAPDVVVVGARIAYPEYVKYGIYVCQPNRSFKPVQRMGFFHDGHIERELPEILAQMDKLRLDPDSLSELSQSNHPGAPEIAAALTAMVEAGVPVLQRMYADNPTARHNKSVKAFLLSRANDPRTVYLPSRIKNVEIGAHGKPVPWAQHQRYTELAKLRGAQTSADLRSVTGAANAAALLDDVRRKYGL